MQPIDQISTGVEYSTPPNNISGALYHKVTKKGKNQLKNKRVN